MYFEHPVETVTTVPNTLWQVNTQHTHNGALLLCTDYNINKAHERSVSKYRFRWVSLFNHILLASSCYDEVYTRYIYAYLCY